MAKFTKPITDTSFDSDVLKSSKPVLVDFWAEWCGPCIALGPKLEEIAQNLSEKVIVAKINVDENPETASKFGIRSIPTMMLFKDGQSVDTIMGNQPKDAILSFINKHI